MGCRNQGHQGTGIEDTGMQGHEDAETKDTEMQVCQSRKETTSTLSGNSILFPHEAGGNGIPMGFWGMQKCS